MSAPMSQPAPPPGLAIAAAGAARNLATTAPEPVSAPALAMPIALLAAQARHRTGQPHLLAVAAAVVPLSPLQHPPP
jgi:hypothetical protein